MPRVLTSYGAALGWLLACAIGIGLLAACCAQPLGLCAVAASDPAASPATAGKGAPVAVGLVWDERFLAHDAPSHVEKAARLTSIRCALQEAHLWDRLVQIAAVPAAESDLLRVHSPEHLLRVQRTAESAQTVWLDGDTYAGKASWEAARLAAGGACAAVDAVMRGDVRSAFCALRPPGHHASRDKAAGFCLFNNVAIAARHAQAVHGVPRIVIFDWDVHHGNGTQDTFYRDGHIMYISIHQSPLYPRTGSAEETGEGPGAGRIRNFPLAPGSGEKEFLAALEEGLKLAETFRPEFVFISCGFDAHKDDTLGGLKLTEHTYAEATHRVRGLADRTAHGRIVSVLEGGYNLEALGRSAVAHVSALVDP